MTTNPRVIDDAPASGLTSLEGCGAFLAGFCLPQEARLIKEQARRRAELLAPEEESAFLALRSEKRRLDWLSGRAAAKRVLARYFREVLGRPLDFTALRISSDAQGAPRCAAEGAPSFSISHCAAGGFCAVGLQGRLVGADWETVAPRSRQLAELFARPGEVAPGQDDALALTRLWAAKEAVLKLLGLGLAAPPRDVEAAAEPRLHGRALRRWRELGSPRLRCLWTARADSVAAVAFSQPQTPGDPA